MSQTTRTYEQLRLLCQAKLGGETIDGTRQARFDALINAAARNAYDSWNFWPRFLVFAEPRSIARGYINYTEDSFKVYGAGTSAVNGLYVRNGTVNGKAAYRLYLSDGTTEAYSIEWDNSTDWQILDSSDNIIYDITDASATPPLSGWAANTGAELPPLLVDLSEMGTILDVHVGNEPYGDYWSDRKKYICDGTGVRLLTNPREETVAYVTYKKNLTDVYGDGNGGTVSAIPNEWSEYMARYAARDIQVGEKVGGDNPSIVIGSREVERAYDDMLWREESQNIQESIGRRIMTHLATNTTLY
jgi:hypothetical protein